MNWRNWAATKQDFAALARLNTLQYPDAPLTAEGVERNWNFVDPDRPTLIRFALENGQEVALVETYPSHEKTFLLEVIAPAHALTNYGPELLEQARRWARGQGAERWQLTLRGQDERTAWFRQQGFQVQVSSTEWAYHSTSSPAVPEGINLKPVGDDPHLQQALRATLNAARLEAHLRPFAPEEFTRDVLNFGVYRPELMWLAQTAAGKTVGCACLHVWEAAEHAEFSWVFVHQHWRRKGVGTALLARASREAKLPHISANLPETHQHLQGLLQQAGFQQDGEWLTAELTLK